MDTQGFTLIEILIIIIIVAILASILIPSLLAARNAANNSNAQAVARNAVTISEIRRSENDGFVVYKENTECIPNLFNKLGDNIVLCQVRQDANTSYSLVKSSNGNYFTFDGSKMIGPFTTIPSGW